MNRFDSHYFDDEDEPLVKIKGREKYQKEPKIMFARWGHMNPKRDKDKEKKLSNNAQAPEKVGIYAFIWPYIEPFLAAWNDDIMVKDGDKVRFPSIKKFQHHGDIWCHFIREAQELDVGKEYKDSWVKVDTKDLPKLLNKVKAKSVQDIKRSSKKAFNYSQEVLSKPMSDPFKVGKNTLGGYTMSKDFLEVFIPGKVRETK